MLLILILLRHLGRRNTGIYLSGLGRCGGDGGRLNPPRFLSCSHDRTSGAVVGGAKIETGEGIYRTGGFQRGEEMF